MEILLTGDPPSHAKLGGGCGGGTEKRWITPRRPWELHLSGSQKIVRSYTMPYPPPRETITISVPPYPIDDSLPTEEEVE